MLQYSDYCQCNSMLTDGGTRLKCVVTAQCIKNIHTQALESVSRENSVSWI